MAITTLIQKDNSDDHRKTIELDHGYAGFPVISTEIIRNSGGVVADDGIRTMIISSNLRGTREWFVIHYADLLLELFSDDHILSLLTNSINSVSNHKTDRRNIEEGRSKTEVSITSVPDLKNLAESVVEDVRRIKKHPLFPTAIPVYGYIFDTVSGKILEVPAASASGAAT